MSSDETHRQEVKVTAAGDHILQLINVNELGGGRRAPRTEGRRILLLPLLILLGSMLIVLAAWHPIRLDRDTALVLFALGSGVILATVVQSVLIARPKEGWDTGFLVSIVAMLAFGLLGSFNQSAVAPLQYIAVTNVSWSIVSIVLWFFPQDR